MHSATTNRNDSALYCIFAYISFFRLDELAIEDYRKLVLSQDAVKMNIFLQFLFNADNLRNNVRTAWMELYDFTYIDEKVIGGVEKNLPNVADILATVEKRATGKATSTLSMTSQGGEEGKLSETAMSLTMQNEQAPKKPTEPAPFNLTKPKPKVVPQPEAIKREVKSNPVPKNMFKKSLEDIEKEKVQRRKEKLGQIHANYVGDTKQRFDLATEKRRPEKKQKVFEDVAAVKKAEL